MPLLSHADNHHLQPQSNVEATAPSPCGDAAQADNSASFANASLAPALRDWPPKPQTLGERTASTVLASLADVLLVLAPIAFIGMWHS